MCIIDNTNRLKFCGTQKENKCLQTSENDKIHSKSLNCEVLHAAKRCEL